MYQSQVHLHSLYNKKSNKCDVGLLWINMAKMFIFHKYIESYFIFYVSHFQFTCNLKGSTEIRLIL